MDPRALSESISRRTTNPYREGEGKMWRLAIAALFCAVACIPEFGDEVCFSDEHCPGGLCIRGHCQSLDSAPAQDAGVREEGRRGPSVRLIEPGSRVLGGTVDVRWLTDDEGASSMAILLSRDGGATFPVLIAAALPDTGRFAWDTRGVDDGDRYRLRLVATDAAGNEGDAADSLDFAIDNVPPEIVIVSPRAEEVLSGAITVAWSTEDAHTSSVSIEISGDGGATYPERIADLPDKGNHGLDSSAFPDGDLYRIRIQPTDRAGNVGLAVESPTFAIDNTPPIVVLLGPIGGEVWARTATIAWMTNDEHPSSAEIFASADSGATYPIAIGRDVPDTGAFPWNTRSDQDGSRRRVRIVAIDRAGNIGPPAMSPADFSIDNTAPVLRLTSPVGSELWSGARSITWTSADANPATVAIRLSGDSGGSFTTLIAAAAPDVGGYLWDTSSLTSGSTYRIQAIPTDAAGNIGAPSASPADFSLELRGPSPGSVSDGLGPDVDFQASATALSASWAGFSSGPGIDAYAWAIGRTPGGTELQTWLTVGNVDNATNASLSLSNGSTYFVSVRAIDVLGNIGGIATSDGVTIDASGPLPGSVLDGAGATDLDAQASGTTLSATWLGFSDAGSGIASYAWAIGTNPGGIDVQPWSSVGNISSASNASLTLSNGVTYYVSVRAVDAVGNLGAPATSDGVTVSSTGPLSGTVRDGSTTDLAFQASLTTISANWSGFSSPNGIASYDWAIGTAPGTTNIQAWTAVGSVTAASSAPLSLSSRTTYYVSVRATDFLGNAGAPATSDGVTVDGEGPLPGTARDGSSADLSFQASTSAISANWSGFSDGVGSGIAGYEWAIGSTPGGTNVQPWTAVGLVSSASSQSLSLASGTTYSVSVRATDAVGNVGSAAVTNGVTVDALAPSPPSIVTYSPNPNTTGTHTVTWSGASDTGSGIATYDLRRSADGGATWVLAATGVLAAQTNWTQSPALGPGTYIYQVRAIDALGNLGVYSTNTNTVVVTMADTTPPLAPNVIIYSPNPNSTGTHMVSWSGATDTGSGIATYDIRRSSDGGVTSTIVATGIAIPQMSWSQSPAVGPGTYIYQVRATDEAGNIGLFSTNTNAVVVNVSDTIAPAPPSVVSYAPTPNNSGTHTVSWSGAADMGGSGIASYDVARSDNGGPFVVIATSVLGTSWAQLPAAAQGSYVYQVRAIDTAGNVGAFSTNTNAVVVDTTAPATPSLTGTSPASPSNASTTPTLSGTAESGSSVRIYTSAACTGTVLGTVTANASGVFNVTVSVSTNSSTTFYAAAQDPAGNISGCSAGLTYIHDTAAPTFGGLSSAMAVSSSQISLTWTAATDNLTAAAQIVYEICRSTTAGQCGGTFTVSETTTAGSTMWNVGGLAASTQYYFVVRARDLATNRDANTVQLSATTTAAPSPSGGAVAKLASGGAHTCALVSDGTAQCWGYNGYGQLGDGTTANSSSPVGALGISNAVSLAAGNAHTCAVLANGQVRCWGINVFGGLGDGTTIDRSTPVAVSGLTNAVAVVAGEVHSCALLSDGTARCWGSNDSGRLGDGSSSNSSTPVNVVGVTNAIAIAASSGASTCALIANGTVRCWGWNQLGQLGDGTTTNRNVSVEVSNLSNATAISAGVVHSCAVLATGNARCWGNNAFGALGDGTTTNSSVPVSVSGISNAVQVAAGGSNGFSCTLIADGTVRCWGYNTYGALGDGTTSHSSTPVTVSGLLNGVAILPGGNHNCALLSDGNARCWGRNQFGQLGDGTTTDRTTPVQVGGLIGNPGGLRVGAGINFTAHTCALRTDGAARCWGNNTSGQLGDGTTIQRTAPAAVLGLSNATAVLPGYDHTCALIADGSMRCWGNNASGKLGDGTSTNTSTPVSVVGVANAVSMAVGVDHTCALLSDGTVRCWGRGAQGQLGDGLQSASVTPVQVAGLGNATEIAAGYYHSCARLSDGSARCWGQNRYGELGDDTTTQRNAPVPVTALSASKGIVAGGYQTCASLADGTVRCWGKNDEGALGDGTTVDRWTPNSVVGLVGVAEMSGGVWHTCALVAGGSMQCWGRNYGSSPTNVNGIVNAAWIAAGGDYSCALVAGGAAFCWGSNNSGQLGDGTTTNRTAPVQVLSFP